MRKKIAILFIISLLLPVIVQGLDVIPEDMQAVLVLKIISFTKNFEKLLKSEVTIGIFNNDEILQHFYTASKKVSFKIQLISLPDTSISIEKINILYIPKGTSQTNIEALNKQAKKFKVLTVCGDPDVILDRNLSLSFYVLNESPKILVNMKSSKEEGISFSGKVLGLADVRNIEK